MKLGILLPLLTVVLTMFVAWALTGCKTTDRTQANNRLPASCTLLSMSPGRRKLHEERLEKLRNASRLLSENRKGFVFAVDLHVLSAGELDAWMENEQKCCSFLRMIRHVREREPIAEVTVECPSETRAEVMRTFGLKTEKGCNSAN